MIPVCSRALLRDKTRPLKRPQDVAHHTLLHFDYAGAETMYMDWGTWLTALGIAELKSAGALHFSQYEQMIQAAISGQGVALGRRPLVSDLIQSGALVAPFKQTLVGSRAYFIIRSSSPPVSRKCANLRNGWSPRLVAMPRRRAANPKFRRGRPHDVREASRALIGKACSSEAALQEPYLGQADGNMV
jgi:LysR family glycine cleavage system transcriptional activator